MRESALETRVGRWCKANDILYYKFTSPSHPGVPDRLCIGPTGTIGFLELKALGKKPSAIQYYEITRLTRRKVKAFWSDDYDDIICFLRGCL